MRIFVFRPRPMPNAARAVRSHGHEPIVAPLFSVVRLPEPAPEGPFAALVLTSGNGVPALADVPAAWRDLPVFTVGARTAAKVRDAGLDDARSADGDRNDLIALIQSNLPAPARLLLVAGRDRHEDVSDRLGEAGYEVATWTAYAAEAVAALPEEAQAALRDGRAEAALHYLGARRPDLPRADARGRARRAGAGTDPCHALGRCRGAPDLGRGEHGAGRRISGRGGAAGGARSSVRSQSRDRGCYRGRRSRLPASRRTRTR